MGNLGNQIKGTLHTVLIEELRGLLSGQSKTQTEEEFYCGPGWEVYGSIEQLTFILQTYLHEDERILSWQY